MVEWTDFERTTISSIFASLDYNDVGPKALCRCLIVYPWTQRYFASFGNLYNPEAIKTNPNVVAHGVKVLHGLDRAVKNMDNIKATYAELSVKHSEQLHVDPDNFRLLADCLTIVIAAKMGSAFTCDVQAALQKFVAVVKCLWEEFNGTLLPEVLSVSTVALYYSHVNKCMNKKLKKKCAYFRFY
uniref:Hemoglobin beta embryonic-3 n=1 Tax=Neogobius melanostomus TaxID=47308 RepID=A0A8C6S7P9_9GOBI